MARVLIIEDERDVGELYRLVLEGQGHTVVSLCATLQEAEQVTEEPQVIILDERVSGESGSDHIPRLRELYPAARILLATADPDAAASAIEKGADDAREKPFSVSELPSLIESLAEDLD